MEELVRNQREGIELDSILVVCFDEKVPKSALEWFVERIRAPKGKGGAELIVRKHPRENNNEVVLHISATARRYLAGAQELELTKKDTSGNVREFTLKHLDDFINDEIGPEDLLNPAEQQMVLRHGLENIRAGAEDLTASWSSRLELYEGQSVLQALQKADHVTAVFGLHDPEHLKRLARLWYRPISTAQPLARIRAYFGDSIALYFTFLEHYTWALVVLAGLGVLQVYLPVGSVPIFCAINVIWVTVFLEKWRRKSNELAYEWGTIDMNSLGDPRANFWGKMGVDEITGKIQPQFSRKSTNKRMYCVSVPVVLVCMLGSLLVMAISFAAEDWVKDRDFSTVIQFAPSVIYSILVQVMNYSYMKLATFLTEWENHRTQAQFDRHQVAKNVAFQFVNNFVPLFYIAFWKWDIDQLRSQLATMFVVTLLVDNFFEIVLPVLTAVFSSKLSCWTKPSKEKGNGEENVLQDVPQVDWGDSRVEQARKEGQLEEYESTYEDYLEMFVQFGYVVLFSSVYPTAAIWAVLNNIVELRVDAFKLCKIYRRPLAKRVKNIGAWQRSFELIGVLSIMTNCGLLCLSEAQKRSGDELHWVGVFVLLEHALLVVRFLLHKAIPDQPHWVRLQLAKKAHDRKLALI